MKDYFYSKYYLFSTIKNKDKTTSSHHSSDNMAKSCTKLVRKKYGIYLVVLQTMYFQSVCVCVCVTFLYY